MVEIAWFWLALAAASSIASAGMSIASGKAQAAGLKGQAAAADLEARVAELGVKQTSARRMEALTADIGAIRAHRAAQNVSANSGSAVAAEDGYEKEYLQTLRADILNQRYGVVARKTSASGLRAGARGALLSGYAGGVSALANGFAQFGSTGTGGGPTKSGSVGKGGS